VGLLGLGLVLPKTRYFLWVYYFLKPYPPNHPTQPTFLDGFDGFFWVDPTHEHPYLYVFNLKGLKGNTKDKYFICEEGKKIIIYIWAANLYPPKINKV